MLNSTASKFSFRYHVDLYTFSMLAITHVYDASIMAVKNTITATMLGFAIDCILSGEIIDSFGRRRLILLGLTVYIIANFMALIWTIIDRLMLVRFIQGVMESTVSIGGCALILDNFTGH